MRASEKNGANHHWCVHPLKRRLLAEEFVRLRRADEQRRFAASLRRIPVGVGVNPAASGCILADAHPDYRQKEADRLP